MSKRVEVKCPKNNCGNTWWINVDDLQDTQTAYKGVIRSEEYTVKCPRCLEKVVIKVQIEGKGG